MALQNRKASQDIGVFFLVYQRYPPHRCIFCPSSPSSDRDPFLFPLLSAPYLLYRFLCCLYGLLTVKVKLCSAHDAFSVCILVLLTRCFLPLFCLQVLVQDLLHPTAASEARKHKLKTLVQTPRSYFLDVKCPGCLNITTVFSHAQTAVTCESCATVLCTPTGGKAKLSEGTSFRRK